MIIEGRAVVIPGDDVDTDVMYPGQFLNIDDPELMKAHLFEGYDPALRDQLGPDTIIVTGANFGLGSSREHVVQAMRAWGVRCLVGVSFARIFEAQRGKSRATSARMRGRRRRGAARLADQDRHRHRRGGCRRPGIRRAARAGVRRRPRVLRWPRPMGQGAARGVRRDRRALGDGWQVVLQTDHADLSAQFAASWDSVAVSKSLKVATGRHDDGWAVWERAPTVDGDGRPVNFLDVDVRSHLAFYRAGIAAITEQDPHAGLLVSMHGAGIYRQRYGLDPGLSLTRAPEVQDEVDAFVAEQEAKFGGEPGEHRGDYELLQLFDRLSLYFCMRDVEAGEAAELQGYRLEPVAPWRVRCDPFPFADGPTEFSLLRRVLPKRPWDRDGFTQGFFAQSPQATSIVIEP